MTKRCGFIALIGTPNAGKSTLMNNLVGAKVAIVTHKVQTTRSRITGVAMAGDAQLVFLDTPGIFDPKRRLERAMVNAAWGGVEGADQVALLIDAKKGLDDGTIKIIEALKNQGAKVIAVLNKVDLVEKPNLLTLAGQIEKAGIFSHIFMISALTGDGVADLKSYLAENVPESPWHYPPDQIADITQRLMASEITREKIYLKLHQELPYASTVETESWEEKKDGSVKISQIIYVDRKSQKGIVIGKGGAMLKLLGAEARAEMEETFSRKVHLFLFVKVAEKWSEQRTHYHAMGLDYVE